MGLTLSEHREVGRMLKRAHRLFLDAAAIVRCYHRRSRQLDEIAAGLRSQRGSLAQKLREQVGEDGMVEGVPVREVYFGELKEREDA